MTSDILSVFPELADIEDRNLRECVQECWTIACNDNSVDSLSAVKWAPPLQRKLDIEDETLVDHVRDVVGVACSTAESLEQSRNTSVDFDLLRAGALIHDVSKLYEFDDMDVTPVFELNNHPYYGVYPVIKAELPVEYTHIVLSHTSLTTVEPAFLEAGLIKRADEIAATAIISSAVDDLRDVNF